MNSFSPNILIDCPACGKSLSATHDMVGQAVECPFCKKQFTVTIPPPDTGEAAETEKVPKESSPQIKESSPQISDAELASLQGQLKENSSQITELRGHVSRLNMELHRHELRMKSLIERQAQLNTQIAAASA